MLTIEELKLSPIPWSVNPCANKVYADVDDAGGNKITEIDSGVMCIEDARIMSAAPEMYKVIWDLCFGETTTVNCDKCGGNDHGIERCSKTCPLYKARVSLAKASGMILEV